jgi:MFS superfamily sulfate permease-like transporter
LAALAAILLIVGYKLAKPNMIVGMWKKGSNEFIPFAVTVVGIVLTDLLMGIALGLVVAIVSILWDNFKVPYKFDIRNYNVGAPIKIEFSEVVSFLNKASIQQTLNTIPPNSTVLLDASQTLRMHPDVHEIIQEFKVNAATKDITLELIGFEATVSETPMADFEEQVLQKPRATTSKVGKLFKKK